MDAMDDQQMPAQDAQEGPRSFKAEVPVDPRWWVHCTLCDERKWSSDVQPALLPPTPTWCPFCKAVTECRVVRPAHLPPEPPSLYASVEYALATDEYRALFLSPEQRS